MAESIDKTDQPDQNEGFIDSFVGSSDLFTKGPMDDTQGSTNEEIQKTEGWEHFGIAPDRSETPDNHNDDDDDDDDSLPEVSQSLLINETKKKQASSWENFEEDHAKEERSRSKTRSNEDFEMSTSGIIVGIDNETKQTEWTALNDTFKQTIQDQSVEEFMPFRRTQSMRADTHRAVRIVDALKQQRRLSNSSLDRERPKFTFSNEDDLTRKLMIERQWDIYLKLTKRIPGTKTKWLPVRVSVKEGVLSIKKNAIPSPTRKNDIIPAVVEDVILQHNHRLTESVPRRYDKTSKLHQIKLQQTIIQERRNIKRLFLMEHVTTSKTLYKLGSHDVGVIDNISEAINEAIRQLPVTRARGVAYRVNETFVDVKESSDILMNCDGAVLDRKSLVRIYIQAFLTGAPECKLILNDIEATLMQGKGLLTQGRQVRLANLVLHPCVNKSLYSSTREIKFQPVDGSIFELLRCSIDPYVSPPIIVTSLMEYNQTQNTVKITSTFTVRKKHNLRLRPITNLIIKFPIPSSWSSLFVAESKFGQQRQVGSTASLRGSFRRKIKTRDCQIETNMGSARYEPEHQAIMWRIGTYTNTNEQHRFNCDILLKPGMQKPDMTNERSEVTYTVPGTSTGIVVKAFNTDDGANPETWVKFEINYRYEVQMFPDLSVD